MSEGPEAMDSKKLNWLVKIGNIEEVKKLVRQGIPLDCTNEDRRSPLMEAAACKKVAVLRELLDMGASVNFTNEDGMTALHYAASQGALQEAMVLLDAGAEVDARNNSGWPLLFMAARCGSLPVVKWLVEELDADPRPEVNGRTADELADTKNHSEVAEYLESILRKLPTHVETEPSPRKTPNATAKKDSKKFPGQDNLLHESYSVSGSSAGPAELKVRHVRQLVQPNDDIYDTTTNPPGLVLLLIYRTFSKPTLLDREGAQYDLINLTNLYEQMGYDVVSHLDKTWEDTIWILEDFSRSERLRKVGCVIVVVSSHGGEEKSSFSTSDGQDVSVNFIHELFIKDQSKEVREMAKLFFFQFCRGDFLPKYQMDNVKCDAPENIISFFSTTAGFVSYRDQHKGSKFLLAVCEVLAERAYKDCLDELFREVQRRYRKNKMRATPEKQDLGFMKKFYFNPRPSGKKL